MPAPLIHWKTIGASITGTSHLKNKLPCQDALEWRVTFDNVLLVAVADGAGSAKYAEIGSALAAKSAIKALADCIQETPLSEENTTNLLRAVIESVRQKVVAESVKLNAPVREFATTLLIVAIGPDWIAAAQIGDGAILAGDAPESLRTITRPVASEYLNETQFLTSDAALDQAQIVFEKGPVRQLALFSDGLQMLCLKMTDASPHPAFFKPLFQFLRTAQDRDAALKQFTSFLESPRITDRTDDDLTLFLAAATGETWET